MLKIKDLETRRDHLLGEVAKAQIAIDAARRRKTVVCNHCGKRSAIRLLTYIQTHWYREPHGCTGGDYWSEGEGRFLCPKCGYENRLIYRPEIVALKKYFGRVEERYEKESTLQVKWCN